MDDRFVNLGKEVILTAMTTWVSESGTVCFVISLSICYWLFKCRVLRVVCVCVCAGVCERGRQSHNHGLFANTFEHHHCFCHATMFPSRAWTDVKTKDIINCLYLFWKLKLTIVVRGVTFPTSACGVGPITMLWVSWPIRTDCACRKGGLCRKRSVWDRWGIEDLQ